MGLPRVAVTYDHDRLKRDRLAMLQAEMVRQDIGALYLSEGPHYRYLLDVKVPSASVFVPVEGDIVAFVRSRDIGYVEMEHKGVQLGNETPPELRSINSDPAGGLRDLMARHGVAGERLGIDQLRPALLVPLIKSGMEIVDADTLCERTASVKTEDEISMYRAIGKQHVRTFEAFRDAIKPGLSELDLAGLVTSTWNDVGGEDIAQLNVCSQENMNPWRRWPTERVLARGELVGIDLHGRGVGGLRGDSSTTFLVGGDPTLEQRRDYREAYDYLQAAIKILRAGRPIAEVMADQPPIPERFREQQLQYHVAHGVSIQHSGYPHIDPKAPPIDDVLWPNQVLSVECVFGEAGTPYAIKLEEMIAVREGEPEIIAGIPLDKRLMA